MQPFDYHAPATLEQALELLALHCDQSAILAGGTDLLVDFKRTSQTSAVVIDIKRIPDLDFFQFDPQNGLRFGARTSVRKIETDPQTREIYPGLAQAASVLGSVQIRNRATVAGNVSKAAPCADMAPPLIVHHAEFVLRSQRGERRVAAGDFFLGPKKTVRAADELLTEIHVPMPAPGTVSIHKKFGRREAMELALVSASIALQINAGRCLEACIALGTAAPTPMRALQAEEQLRGQMLDDKIIASAATAAMQESRPRSSNRAPGEYRRQIIGVLIESGIRELLAQTG
jgi:CO/xanthine dehydrogenase FAD-binding subunit